jgi:transcriptional regulator with XRE-family HTH domain
VGADERLTDPGALHRRLAAERESRKNAGEDGMTQRNVADAIGVSDALLGFWEAGTRSPNFHQMRKWLVEMGKPESWADEWFDYKIEERMMEIIGPTGRPKSGDPPKPTKPIAPEDLDGLRWSIRKVLRAERCSGTATGD